jgi:hypothetical protein
MKTATKGFGVLVGMAVMACIALVGLGSGFGTRGEPVAWSSHIATEAAAGPQATLFLRFGVTDREPAEWDGKIDVSAGTIERLAPWRFMQDDAIDGASWRISTRRMPPQSAAERERGADAMPMGDNGLFVTLAGVDKPGAAAKISVTTKQGDFTFTLNDVPLGKRLKVLDGRAEVQRVPSSSKIISTPAEEDFPAAAVAPDGTVYVAYLAFTHGKGFAVRPTINEPPKEFAFLTEPTGGDQLWLARFTPGKDGAAGKWEQPIAVTQPGQDLYKPAVAVDGKGRVWVFWSSNLDSDGKGNGNWELMARSFADGEWSNPFRLTQDAGSDFAPAAATDSAGQVWVVWQAFRGMTSDILAVRQDGEQFGQPLVVSDASGNKWDPAIAASPSGTVAFAWDTYEQGDYDVHVRVWFDGKLGAMTPVAASERYEVRPSLVYDKAGRLWIAWEEAPEKWGKDFGAHEADGWPLYRRHSVNVHVLADGKLHRTKGDVTAALPSAFEGRPGRAAAAPAPAVQVAQAKKAAAKKNAAPRNAGAHDERQDNRPPTSMPRLTTDAAGRVWLAFRARTINTRATVGTIWHEFVSYYDGANWVPGTLVPSSDALLDNRPAWAAPPNGQLMLVSSTDGRHASIQGIAVAGATTAQEKATTKKAGQAKTKKAQAAAAAARGVDIVNYDLAVAWMPPMPSVPGPQPALEVVDAPKRREPADYVKSERDDVRRIRAFRTKIGDKTVRIVRGEFHRHTEISGDGGGDGTLQEMWRYGIDAAAMDWIGNGDHDNGNGREYTWWLIQKTTDIFTVDGSFTPLYTYERSVGYPDGHRNVAFERRGIRTLPRLAGGTGKAMDAEPAAPRPNTPDTQMLYAYLKQFGGICALHTSGTSMGTDWRDNDPAVEPFVEIYQGDRQNYEMPGAPRSNTEDWSIGGWRPLGFVSLALKKGYRLAFQASSDHVSTHMSYCNVFVEEPTREAIVRAMRQRRVYGATDNIIADFRSGDHFMGEEFEHAGPASFEIRLVGTGPFERVHIIRNNECVYSWQSAKSDVEIKWTDADPPKGTNYYYVRGEQEDGELVWVSPIWIRNGGGSVAAGGAN